MIGWIACIIFVSNRDVIIAFFSVTRHKYISFVGFFEEINENELRATLGDKLLREYKLNRVGTYMTHIEDY